MKNILFLTVGICWSLLATAQPTTTKKEVYCDKTETLISILKGKDFEEVPIWFGKADGKAPNYSLLVNQETKTWTIIQFNNDVACVLGTGEGFTVLTKKTYT